MSNKKTYKTLRLLLTNQCDLGCTYCCAEGHRSEYNHLNAENIGYILRVCNQLFDIKRIKLTGGEPFKFAGINEVIQTIHEEKENGQIVSIVTNGVAIKPIMDTVNQYKNIDLTISLPSLDSNIFHKITGRGELFNRVLNTIKYLNSSNYTYKLNIVLVDGVTNTKENIKSIIDYFGGNHNVQLRFLELSINNINRDTLRNLNYTTSNDSFKDIINTLGFKMVGKSDCRESVNYVRNGLIIKYIKFFCSSNCVSCPEEKTSLWLSCDGYLTSCAFNMEEAIHIEKLTYNGIYNTICESIDSI